MSLKKTFILAGCLAFSACSNDNNKGSSSAESAIGSWELTKIVGPQGQSIDVQKPTLDPVDDTYHQLVVTKDSLKLISTDTVTVSVWGLPAQFKGSRIITVDTETTKMPDYEIVSNNGSTITYKMTDDETGGFQPVTFIARRISDDQTAMQKALIFNEPQTIDVIIDGILYKSNETIGKITSTDDMRTIRCMYNISDNSLDVQYSKWEKTEDGISFGGDNDSILIRIPLSQLSESDAAALKLQASSISKTAISSLEHVMLDKVQWKSYGNSGCSSQIEKDGPRMKIQTTCNSKDADKKNLPLKLKTSCFMQKFFL